MKKRYYFILIYLIVNTLIVTAVSFSKYSTVAEGSSQVTVAYPLLTYTPRSLTFNGEPVSEIGEGLSLADVMPGDVLEYKFDIENFEGSDVNQVLLKYLISIVFDPSEPTLPLKYTLVPDGAYPSAGGDWIYLGFGEQLTHGYTLTVMWDEDETDPSYTNKQQDIQIEISTQQADSLS